MIRYLAADLDVGPRTIKLALLLAPLGVLVYGVVAGWVGLG